MVSGRFYVLAQYVRYFLEKVDQFSIHSPFVYKLYTGLKDHTSKFAVGDLYLESKRREFAKNNNSYSWVDKGAGSHQFGKKTVSSICRFSNSTLKYNLLYQYLCSLTPSEYVVELGGSLGLNAAYLSKVCLGKVYSLEGDPQLVNLAAVTLERIPNVNQVLGAIEDTLPGLIQQIPRIDFALIDANHTEGATLDNFHLLFPHLHEQSIVVVGDIYWSKGMTRAWKAIKDHPGVSLSLDFFECGVLFFNLELSKENYVLDY
ncbi:O-methyltransferase [Pleomorphovibrio marinus]|uniref:O-methyltransferase n=1 Tax=Pleomorphovibrio marinus TaxID=2164132 RepID=UPI000E0AAB4B|nr:class I SAM-dependent methyltransferase [Pleomorphovibrio marinus]